MSSREILNKISDGQAPHNYSYSADLQAAHLRAYEKALRQDRNATTLFPSVGAFLVAPRQVNRELSPFQVKIRTCASIRQGQRGGSGFFLKGFCWLSALTIHWR